MADNVLYTAGSGTTIASDEISSVHHQRIKISLGADGSATDAVGAAGAVSAAVQRVTLASDDPAVTALEIIDNILTATTPAFTRPGRPTTAGLTNASLSFATLGDNTLVSATVSQTIRVFRLVLVVEGDVGVKLMTGVTNLTGVMKLKDGGSIILDFDGEPWFVTGSNEAFIANLDAAVNVRGFIQYVKG